jgi:hypothetical protein
MSYIGNMQSVSFDTYREPSPLGFIMQTYSTLDLIGFTDSNWASDNIDRKSISSYSLSLGSGPIYWLRKKKDVIALSSAEVEYRGVVNITIQAMWLQHFLTELGI